MKTKLLICACILSSAIYTSAVAQGDPKTAKDKNEKKSEASIAEEDMKFAVFAADAGMKEVQLGKIAQKNGSTPQVKELGRKMVEDHTKANDELKALASKKNITLPTKMSEKNQNDYEKLAKLQGTEFDKAYTKAMVKDHEMVIEAYEKEAEKGEDLELKAWANAQLPALKHHLEMFEESPSATK